MCRLLLFITIVLYSIAAFGILTNENLELTVSCLVGLVTSLLVCAQWELIFKDAVTDMRVAFIIQASGVMAIIGVYSAGKQDSLAQINIGLFILLPMLIIGSFIIYSHIKRNSTI